MPADSTQPIEMLWAAVAEVPAALLVIVLLAGPTAVWIAYRRLNASSRQRSSETTSHLLWICASCRSANEVRRDRCYRCGVAADVDALEIVEPQTRSPSEEARPVMLPGLDLGGRSPVAVGPGKGSAVPEPEPAPAPAVALDDAPVASKVEVPKAASPRRVAVAAGRKPSQAGPDSAAADGAESEPSSMS